MNSKSEVSELQNLFTEAFTDTRVPAEWKAETLMKMFEEEKKQEVKREGFFKRHMLAGGFAAFGAVCCAVLFCLFYFKAAGDADRIQIDMTPNAGLAGVDGETDAVKPADKETLKDKEIEIEYNAADNERQVSDEVKQSGEEGLPLNRQKNLQKK